MLKFRNVIESLTCCIKSMRITNVLPTYPVETLNICPKSYCCPFNTFLHISILTNVIDQPTVKPILIPLEIYGTNMTMAKNPQAVHLTGHPKKLTTILSSCFSAKRPQNTNDEKIWKSKSELLGKIVVLLCVSHESKNTVLKYSTDLVVITF